MTTASASKLTLKGVAVKRFGSSQKTGSSGEIEQFVQVVLEAKLSPTEIAELASLQRDEWHCVVSFAPQQSKLGLPGAPDAKSKASRK